MHVLLVDDHAVARCGTKFLLDGLAADLVFLEAETVEGALVHADKRVDLILLDLGMPGVNGLAAISAMRAAFASSRLVVLSANDDPNVVLAAIKLGAAGFVPKGMVGDALSLAVRLVLAGEVFLPSQLLKSFNVPDAEPCVADDAAATPVFRPEGLSDREFEVLQKVIQGKPNKVIARELKLSEHTIKHHLGNVFRVLGVRNRTEVGYAVDRAAQRRPANAVTALNQPGRSGAQAATSPTPARSRFPAPG